MKNIANILFLNLINFINCDESKNCRLPCTESKFFKSIGSMRIIIYHTSKTHEGETLFEKFNQTPFDQSILISGISKI